MSDKFCFGIDIGGTTVKLGLFSAAGTLLYQWQIPTNKEALGQYILTEITTSLFEVMAKKKIEKHQILGVGVGVPGPVTSTGEVLFSVNLGWGRFNVEEQLKALTGFEVKATNDANIAALGECYVGGGKGFKDLVMITLGTGCGSGIIVGGKCLAGVHGAAGEIGHLKIALADEVEGVCNCGNSGCLEQIASATGIVKMAKRMIRTTTLASQLRTTQYITAKLVLDLAKTGDQGAVYVVEQMATYLARAISYVSIIVDPEVVVIGGGVSKAGDYLIDLIAEKYREDVFKTVRNLEFRLAELGNDAGIYGGAYLIIGN